MLFLSSRARNTMVPLSNINVGLCTNKLSHTCVVFGSLAVITGIILVLIGVINEIKNSTYIGVALIIFGFFCFLTALIYFYGKFDICYNNWIYRSRVAPVQNDDGQSKPVGVVSISPEAKSLGTLQKPQITAISENPSHKTVISTLELHHTVNVSTINGYAGNIF